MCVWVESAEAIKRLWIPWNLNYKWEVLEKEPRASTRATRVLNY